MIVFDLQCATGHVFEAWFGSSADFEGQRTRGLVNCPVCADSHIEKAVMAPRLSAGGEGAPLSSGAPDQARLKSMLADLAQMQAKALEKSEWVGRGFADEARAMHHGEREQRAIHGQATGEDAAALVEEGIAVAPLPFPVAAPDELN